MYQVKFFEGFNPEKKMNKFLATEKAEIEIIDLKIFFQHDYYENRDEICNRWTTWVLIYKEI